MPKTIALGLTHPGTVRNHNENAFYLLDTLVPGESGAPAAHALHSGQTVQFFAVAAGIGGYGIGDAAAWAALTELQSASCKVQNLARFDFLAFGRTYLQAADRAVRKALRDRSGVFAGASLAMLCLAGTNAYVLACGDCRCYRLRNGELMLLTDDDARDAAPPHQLTSFLGRLAEDGTDQLQRLRQFRLETEDVFLLTSHGLTDRISDEVLQERLNAPEIFTAKPEHLLRHALANDARDNLGMVLLRIIDIAVTEPEPAPRPTHPRHHIKPPLKIDGYALRTGLVLLASIALGFFAGWILLTMIF